MEPQTNQSSLQKKHILLDPTTLIIQAWAFYKANVKRLWPLFILGSLDMLSFRSNPVKIFSFEMSIWVVVLIITAIIIISLLLLLSKIALWKSISDVRKGQFVSIKDSYKKANKLFWSFVLLNIIVALSTFGALALLIVPGIILLVYVIFSRFELIDSGKKDFKAILGSWELVRDYWWGILWRSFVAGLMIGLIVFAGFFALGIVVAILIFIAYLSHSLIVLSVFISVSIVAYAAFIFGVIAPLGLLTSFELYFNLKSVRANDKLADENTNKNRKNKIIVTMILGGLIYVLLFVSGIALAYTVKRNIYNKTHQTITTQI